MTEDFTFLFSRCFVFEFVALEALPDDVPFRVEAAVHDGCAQVKIPEDELMAAFQLHEVVCVLDDTGNLWNGDLVCEDNASGRAVFRVDGPRKARATVARQLEGSPAASADSPVQETQYQRALYTEIFDFLNRGVCARVSMARKNFARFCRTQFEVKEHDGAMRLFRLLDERIGRRNKVREALSAAKRSKRESRLVPYVHEIPAIIRDFHAKDCFGRDRVLATLGNAFYIQGKRTLLAEAKAACRRCQEFQRKPKARVEKPIVTARVLQHVVFDLKHFTFATSDKARSKFYVLVVIDHFSKYVWTEAFPAMDAEPIVDFIFDLFNREGFPEVYSHDNGSAFVNRYMAAVAARHNTALGRTGRPYHPQSQGIVERKNRVLDTWMGKKVDGGKFGDMGEDECLQELRQLVRAFANAENTQPIKLYGFALSPFEILRRRNHRGEPFDDEAWERLRASMVALQRRQAAKWLADEEELDASVSLSAPIHVGSVVRVLDERPTKKRKQSGSSIRVGAFWSVALVVEEVDEGRSFRVKWISSGLGNEKKGARSTHAYPRRNLRIKQVSENPLVGHAYRIKACLWGEPFAAHWKKNKPNEDLTCVVVDEVPDAQEDSGYVFVVDFVQHPEWELEFLPGWCLEKFGEVLRGPDAAARLAPRNRVVEAEVVQLWPWAANSCHVDVVLCAYLASTHFYRVHPEVDLPRSLDSRDACNARPCLAPWRALLLALERPTDHERRQEFRRLVTALPYCDEEQADPGLNKMLSVADHLRALSTRANAENAPEGPGDAAWISIGDRATRVLRRYEGCRCSSPYEDVAHLPLLQPRHGAVNLSAALQEQIAAMEPVRCPRVCVRQRLQVVSEVQQFAKLLVVDLSQEEYRMEIPFHLRLGRNQYELVAAIYHGRAHFTIQARLLFATRLEWFYYDDLERGGAAIRLPRFNAEATMNGRRVSFLFFAKRGEVVA